MHPKASLNCSSISPMPLSHLLDRQAYRPPDPSVWWKNRPLRIYHPNMREVEAENFDIQQFMAHCKALHAEAVVFSVGGIYAFYDTTIPYHRKSPHMGERDLLSEVIEEAAEAGIRVIARFDFSKAREDLFRERPEWFRLDANGNLEIGNSGTDDRLYRTALLEGYQNEAFALPVLHEVLSTYPIDGLHLNAPGFGGRHFQEATLCKFDIPRDAQAQQRWREERLAEQMKTYRCIIEDSIPDALFMAEINSPESPDWGTNRGFNHELLAGSYTHLLSTAGRPDDRDLYRLRWWAALTADWSHASKSEHSGLPIVNLKVGHHHGKLSLKPVNEYRFYGYQAMAHHAGIKAPTYGLMSTMPDPRTESMIADVFRFMERCEPYLTHAERIAPVALVWPAQARPGCDPASYRDEMLGLYRGLVSEHVLFEIVLAHRLADALSKSYDVVVVPSVAILDPAQTAALQAFVEEGGHLVLLDALPETPMPSVWRDFIGGTWSEEPSVCAYAVSAPTPPSGLSPVIMVNKPVRTVDAAPDADPWYYRSPTPGGSYIPEVFPVLERGDQSVLFYVEKGEGSIVYFAGALGTMMWDHDLPDTRSLLLQMVDPPAKPRRMLETDAPGTVNVTAYRTQSTMIVHLVNGTGTIPLDQFVPVGPIHIRLPNVSVDRIEWLAPGQAPQALTSQADGETMNITLPTLNAYGLLVLE